MRVVNGEEVGCRRFFKRPRDKSLKSPEIWREWALSLCDIIGRVLQLDDRRGMMLGYRGIWGVPYSGIHLGGWEREQMVSACVVWRRKRRVAASEPGAKWIGE